MQKDFIVVEVKDKREEYLLDALKGSGYRAEYMTDENIELADVLLFAMSSKISPEIVSHVKRGCVAFSRGADAELAELYMSKGILHLDYMDDEAFVVKNAHLTAEGALSFLIQNCDISLRHMHALVLGYGRVAKSMAKVLKDNYSQVDIATDNKLERNIAVAFEDNTFSLSGYHHKLPEYNAIINTVPKIILQGEILKLIDKKCFILDLASLPGGLDFKEAEDLGLKFMHALGVPGRIAPKTAGLYLKDSIVERLIKIRDER